MDLLENKVSYYQKYEKKHPGYFHAYQVKNRESVRRNTRNCMRRKRGKKNNGYLIFNQITQESKLVHTINEGAAYIGCCFLTFRKLIDSNYSFNHWIGERAL